MQKEEKALEAKTPESACSYFKRIKNILGDHYRPCPISNIEQNKEALLKMLEEKYSR